MTTSFFLAFAGVVFAVETLLRLRGELHMAQQNSYRPERYRRWLAERYFGKMRIVEASALPAVGLFALGWPIAGALVWAVFYGFLIIVIRTERHKKPLVMTKRARRIYSTSIGLLVVGATAVWLLLGAFLPAHWLWVFALWLWLVNFAMPVVLLKALFFLKPVEAAINRYYYRDAQKRLAAMPQLKIIGITGSYGKTSVKHFLTRILSEKYNVLMTPGSYNTLMGLILTVRTHLKPIHEIFVAEMGAKQLGDIKELCDFAKPHMGILTAVGPQHLDTFGSLKNVQRTKFELIEAIPKGGVTFANLDFPLIAERPKRGDLHAYHYGVEQAEHADYSARNIRYSGQSLTFDLCERGEKVLELQTRLLGEVNVSNLVVAAGMALLLGVPPERIRYAVSQLQPVPHRLELKKVGKLTVLDDAFNSNPTGAKMALRVLGQMQGGQKIIITPGMIELGEEWELRNHEFGQQIAEHADYAILVGRKQTAPIQAGLKAANYPSQQLFVAKNLLEAQQELARISQPGDVVLYENDLPDTCNEE